MVEDGKLSKEVVPLSTTLVVTDREPVPSREDSEGVELELVTGIGRYSVVVMTLVLVE